MVLIFKVLLYGVRAPNVQCTTVAFNKVTHQHLFGLISCVLGVNMWNKEHLSSDFYLLKTILQFKIKPWCTNEQCWILFYWVYGEKFQRMSIIADNTNGFTSMLSLFFAQVLSSAFSWISVKFTVTICVVFFELWLALNDDIRNVYLCSDSCFFLFRNEEINAYNP